MRHKYFTQLNHIVIVTALLILSSCNKFLDEKPSKESTLQITTTQQLDMLLEDYNGGSNQGMGNEADGRIRIPASDDFNWTPALPTQLAAYGNSAILFGAIWERKLQEQQPNAEWTWQWNKVFKANLVLSKLGEVTGSEADKTRLRADAHFIRAFAYWTLANVYCLPYNDANRNELGLPIKRKTTYDEDLARVSLQATYEFIEADLKEALLTPQNLVVGTTPRHWRTNTAGVNAFAARFYLFLGNYAEAEKYATASLNLYNSLVDYNTEMGFSTSQPIHPITRDRVDLTWKEFTSYRVLAVTNPIIPSADLIALYDQANDWRYIYHFVEGGANNVNHPLSYAFFGTVNSSSIPTGTRVSETILTKAEALARLDRVAEAMNLVNQLRVKRLKPGSSGINLIATLKDDAIAKILAERRRELPFGMRFFDLRRLNHNEDPNDNKTLTRQFYPVNSGGAIRTEPIMTYTLAPGDRKYALPIPTLDIQAAEGRLIQNTY